MMRVALVVEIAGVNPDDGAADVADLRVPSDPIADLESFIHLRSPNGVYLLGHSQVDLKDPSVTREDA